MAGHDAWKVLPFTLGEWQDEAKSFNLFLRGVWIYRCLTLAKMACRQTGGEKAKTLAWHWGLSEKRNKALRSPQESVRVGEKMKENKPESI